MCPVPPGDGIGPNMHVVVAVDISARREAEAALLRHVEAQREVVNLGRLALKGGCLSELFDEAVGAAARVLSCDCAQLFERVRGTQDLTVVAVVGWPEERKGERSSVAVLIGELEAPLGVLAVHYKRAGAVQAYCPPFLDALANVLAEAIR